MRNGFFVDIGAFDGLYISNSLFFERVLGWQGICIEPIPELFKTLTRSRKCTCIQGCIADFTGTSSLLVGRSKPLSGLKSKMDPKQIQFMNRFGGVEREITTNCYKLNDILKEHHVAKVDFLSIDTEGGELDIIKSIDFSKVDIDVITVENNWHNATFQTYLREKGYQFIKRLGVDEVYRKIRDN